MQTPRFLRAAGVAGAFFAIAGAGSAFAQATTVPVRIGDETYSCVAEPAARGLSISRSIYNHHKRALDLQRLSDSEIEARGLDRARGERFVDSLPATVSGRRIVATNVRVNPVDRGPGVCVGVSADDERGRNRCRFGVGARIGVTYERAVGRNWCRVGGDIA